MRDRSFDTEGFEPEVIEKHENRWAVLAAIMLGMFIGGVFIVTLQYLNIIPRQAAHGSPAQLLSHQILSRPRVEKIGDNEYAVYVLARTWQWEPDPIRVPAKAKITVYITAIDILHGFQIMGTNVNVMGIPGDSATVQYTFSKPGTYKVVCNEYCGVGHENMLGTIVVEEGS